MKNSMFCDFMTIVRHNSDIHKHYNFAVEYGNKMDDEQINRFKTECCNLVNRLCGKINRRTDRVMISDDAFKIAQIVSENPCLSRENLNEIRRLSCNIQVAIRFIQNRS